MRFFIAVTLVLLPFFTNAQNSSQTNQNPNKGKMYLYWGWNRGWYSNSTINFRGDNYNFTLQDVVAKDRQSPFRWSTYFGLKNISIPQYNFRLGYFLKENWDVSLGIDHMKYVMQQNQAVQISGEINNSNTQYDGVYDNDNITLAEDFLKYEHTDGLNYANIELRHHDRLLDAKNFSINLIEGFGGGGLYPKTNATLLANPRHDDFHVSGYGFGAVLGLNFTFYKNFFIQTEAKGGYINMPDVRTTQFAADRASQHFYFGQLNAVFGGSFRIN